MFSIVFSQKWYHHNIINQFGLITTFWEVMPMSNLNCESEWSSNEKNQYATCKNATSCIILIWWKTAIDIEWTWLNWNEREIFFVSTVVCCIIFFLLFYTINRCIYNITIRINIKNVSWANKWWGMRFTWVDWVDKKSYMKNISNLEYYYTTYIHFAIMIRLEANIRFHTT